MTFKSNIEELILYFKNASSNAKQNIEHIIKLYKERRIVNYKSAFNVVRLLSSKNKLTINSGKPDREYNKLVLKYETATLATGRIAREMENKDKNNSFDKK